MEAVAATTDYETWARAFHGHAFRRRSAERDAAFLLPHLTAGQRLLDLGCGPGTITEGLAARTEPGQAVGLDQDREFVEAASEKSSRSNLRFQVGDAAALPFEDDSFDVVFAHALLQHVASPGAVLSEVRRVLRPGGVAAVADADLDGFLLHPQTESLRAAVALDRRTRRNPDVGRRLVALLVDAGISDVELTIVPSVVVGPDQAMRMAEASATRFEAPPFAARAVDEGWATSEQLTDMAAAWRSWGQEPGAVFVTQWCQALGRG